MEGHGYPPPPPFLSMSLWLSGTSDPLCPSCPGMVSSSIISRIQAKMQKKMLREFLGELMSTYIMMVFGLGSVAQMVLGEKKFGSYLSVNLGFGFGVTMGVHLAGGISGAHMNSAVTFANCALGLMSWKKFPIYVLGQFLGSFLAAATIYCLFHASINEFSNGPLAVTGPTATAGIFATYLPSHMTLWQGFLDEVFLTGLLQLCLFAITDKQNSPALEGTQGLAVGLLVVLIGVSLGMNSGYAINPSRDLPPRFFTFIAGWGSEVFRDGGHWWWVPVVAPPLGALIGGIIYLVFLGSNTPPEERTLELPSFSEEHNVTKMKSHSSKTSPLSTISVSSKIREANPQASFSHS
ncbi:PREDICTED: aquaporin-7 [Chrysochloris asiatica]|uniref:Aquaporin-7 n=1 Tax=Chrysochloris asiatica TaxID=185453 RepID=A0A9B0WMM2_CHRAS|nr:PREDICTED: aquaporin-7 [Chrysochloris asiatica]